MSRSTSLLRYVVFLLALAANAKCSFNEENGILILTDDNIDQAVKDFKYLMVMFYVPCTKGNCHGNSVYWERYERSAQQLAEEGNPAKLGKININRNPIISAKNNPAMDSEGEERMTIVFYKEGIKRIYTDKIKSRNIVPWIKRRTRPQAQLLGSADDINEMKELNEVVIIGYFSDPKCLEAEEFLRVATGDLDEQEFAIVSDPAVIKKFSTDNSIVLYKQFDEGEVKMEGGMIMESISKFVLENHRPLVFPFTRARSKEIFGSGAKGYLSLIDSTKAENHEERMKICRKLAKEYKNTISFILTNADDDAELVEHLEVDQVPALMMIAPTTSSREMDYYKPAQKDVSEESIREFIKSFLAGELKKWAPVPKSASLPDDWDKLPVKVLVGRNVEKVAKDTTKNVLIEFYAPWCGHCKRLEPIYKKLAEKYKDSSDVVIAKMDSTENEAHGFSVSSYPTLRLYKAGDNKMVEYNGDRTLRSLTEFLTQNGVQVPSAKKESEKKEDGEKHEL